MTGDATGRVSADDLAFAAEWMDAYDGADTDGNLDENDHAARRVAAWLRAEADRRANARAVRDLVSKTGATPAQARAALRKAMSQHRTEGP